MSVSPSSRKRKVGESNPIQPRFQGSWLATRFLSQFGYLPSVHQVDRPRIELGFPPRQDGVVPLDHQPVCSQWTAWESNPSHRPCKGQSPPTACRPVFQRSVRDLNPVFRLTTAACGRNTYRPIVEVVPGRIELPISWVSSRCLHHWTTGSCSDRGRSRTCKIAKLST